MFVAEMEYFSLRYHAFLFEPPLAADALSFWQWESTRFDKFIGRTWNFFNIAGKDVLASMRNISCA